MTYKYIYIFIFPMEKIILKTLLITHLVVAMKGKKAIYKKH